MSGSKQKGSVKGPSLSPTTSGRKITKRVTKKIDKTEADFWIQILSLGVDNYCKLIFEVPRLKRIVEKYKATHSKMVGDRNASKCVLIPLNELFEKDNVAV